MRAEFEAVYHTARVSVNGKPAGEHLRKGYTAFTLDITRLLKLGAENAIEVQVDNSFVDGMLPRGASFDWAPDGGLYRPVSLLVTPHLYIENVAIEAVPDLKGKASLEIVVALRNAGAAPASTRVEYEVADTSVRGSVAASVPARGTKEVRIAATLESPKLWHFDHPHLYTLRVTAGADAFDTTFGVRSFEVRDGGFYLNGERIRPMGVERMAGSHPDYGMAEPESWIDHDHRDMKELNCVFTRVHWPQDRRVLDFCDRHGILIQTEVPSWGPDTFKGMPGEPSAEIMQNGLEQLREMIARDRNHPSIFAWGLCNEVNGQNPPAQKFIRRMAEEARKLDPRRPVTYASHSLRTTPERDVAGELDFISWNEYYGSWQRGDAANVRENLEAIHKAFPSKPIVVSEYGYCECRPDLTGGDPFRIHVLRSQTAVFREKDYVAGLIFFCYNDYRTHIGDKGFGVLKQRVHGVVDVYGGRKPSFDALAEESAPIDKLELRPGPAVYVRTRADAPSYTLAGYRLRWIVYREGNTPVEQHETALPELKPGAEASAPLKWEERGARKVVIEVRRPTGFVAASLTHVPG